MFVEIHGEAKAPQSRRYRAWCKMKERCSPNNKDWKYYGGRGITICDEWKSFLTFAEDMGSHPGPGWTLDRENNDGNYEPNNCRWATRKTQTRNSRQTTLTDEQANIIRRRRLAGENGAAIGREYGITRQMVCDIAHGNNWI